MIETAVGGGVVILLVGIVSNRLFKRVDDLNNKAVPKEMCINKHDSLEKLITFRFDTLEKKVDKLNNVKG